MKRILTFLILLTIGFTAYSQQHLCPPSITHQGVEYSTVWVGGNCWMKENLRSTAYASQSNVVGFTPTYVVYPNIPFSFGYLYTWYSAVGLPEGSTATPPTAISERVQGICPNEWAMPSTTQLAALYAAGEPRANDAAYWVYGSAVAPSGTNGFNMLPAGYFNAQTQNFYEYKLAGYLWALNYNGATSSCGIFPFDCRSTSNMTMSKYNMLSVRCVKAPPYGVEEVTACNSYTWNGNTYDVTGRYVANLPNDSVSTLLLTINYTTYGTLDILECDSYYWDITEQTYTTSGVHVATIENYLGCDSIVTLNLEVRYSNTGIDVQDHCDSYEWIDGITYTESTNEPTFVVTNAAGCDSTVTLNLTIRKMTTGIDVQNHCDAYTWIDGITYTESTNEPTFTLVNAAGCDSVVTLNLTIRNKTYGIDVQDHCDTYTWINEVTYTESTDSPVFTITNAAGCDSIVTLNLTIRNSTSSPSVSLTEYNTYTWNEMTYTTSGIYTATLTNAVGCDSTATLDLTILYRFPITYNLDGGAFPSTYPENYVQGVGATLPIPTKLNNRFDGWYDNATFTGSPITVIGNTESGDKQYWALWTVLGTAMNSSLSFSGSSSAYAQIPDAPALNPTTAVTLEAWIFPTSWRTSIFEGSIIAKEIATGNGGYILRCGAGGKLSFALGIGTTFVELATTTNILTLNQWQHVAGTYDGTTMRIYLNGVEVGNKAQTGPINVSSNPVEIGRNFAYTSRYFTGRIDEARIFNTALDAATILEWYNKSVNNTHGNYANLVGYYEFDNIANPAVLVGTIGSNGTVVSATYNTLCTASPFNSANISAPSTATAIHPLVAFNKTMHPVAPGDTLAQILRIEVKSLIGGALSQVVLSTNGTTNPVDITRARLWYTGTSTTFSTATPFGTPVLNPNGNMTFTGNIPTNCGSSYYLWLTYDISPSASFTNVVDAELVNCTVERLTITPLVGAPAGNRMIVDPCTYHILQIRDFFGDSWNGNFISVMKNSDTIFSNLTITEGPGTDRFLFQDWYNYPFVATPGDTIRIIRTVTGSYTSEVLVQIIRGSQIGFASTSPVAPPAVLTYRAGCFNTITATTGPNGTIAPLGTTNIYGAVSQTYTITPNQFYYIDSVIVNGVNNPAAVSAGTYTFSNITSAQTIRSTFATNYVTPTLITPPSASTILEGDAINLSNLTGGLVEHNGTPVAGTFTWTNPSQIINTNGIVNVSVTFTPTLIDQYFAISFNVPVNVISTSVMVAATGTSTTNTNVPFFGNWMDATTQKNYILYPDSMMTGLVGKTLTSMTFYTTTPASFNFTSPVNVNLGPTTLTSIPSTGTVAFTPTNVFTGTVSIVANQVVITFNTPYLYTGGNLIFEFNSTAAGTFTPTTFTGVSRPNTSRRTYNTTTNIYSFIPRTKFNFLP